jgi:Formate/nitrite family of transporters
MANVKTPAEILDTAIDVGVAKGNSSFAKLAILAVFGGAFIGLAAEGSNMAAFNLLSDPSTYGLGRLVAGAIFGVGLMLVCLAGAELFTGNCLMITTCLEKKLSWGKMFRNWGIVYVFNLAGGLLIAFFMFKSGLFCAGGNMLGAMTVKIAAGKTSLAFGSAFILGILCNWLVCLAVWLNFGADTMFGKMMGIWFPLWLFVTSGFEHSIANMYYIPAGILAKSNEIFVNLSGATPDALASLTWGGFFLNNLLPVTLGNLVGGGIFVAMAYWFVYKKA